MRFRGPYAFLSNFYPSPIVSNTMGGVYPTAEHLYQACKAADGESHEIIRTLPSPVAAKRYGARLRRIRTDWHATRVSAMHWVVHEKFSQNADLRSLLLQTGDIQLVEENLHGDCFWGTCNGKGENKLGHILMTTRGFFR